jgi:hypothetical protein
MVKKSCQAFRLQSPHLYHSRPASPWSRHGMMQNVNTSANEISRDGELNDKEMLGEKHHDRELEDEEPATRGLEKAADEKEIGGDVRKSKDASPDENKDQADNVVTEKGNATTDITGGPTDDEEPEDESKYLSGVKLWTLSFGLCLTTFVIALDNTIIATAIPKITSVFNSLDDVGWYGSSYLLTTTSLQPSFGKVYTY